LKALRRAPRQPELDRLLAPLMDALETVHQADYLHRDIAPDNIMIRRDGQPVLIDFGSARGDIAKHSKTISALVKPGYSPYEQYATTSRQQGPWTDIYSLAATLYEAVTGRRPQDAPTRMVADELVPSADAALSSYRPRFLAAIDKGLRLEIVERPRTVAEWRTELLAPAPQRIEPAGVAKVNAPSVAAPVAESKPKAKSKHKAEALAEAAEARDGMAAASDRVPSGGIAAAFLDGWRKGAPATPRKTAPPAKPVSSEPRQSAKQTPDAAKSRSESRVAIAQPPKRRALFAWRKRAAPQRDEPAARPAAPQAIRKRAAGVWRSFVLNVMLALFIAAAVVAVQDQIPRVHLQREGAGVLMSYEHGDVPLADLKGHRGAVTGLAFTSDGQQIVTASLDGTLKVWNASKGGLARTLEFDAGGATVMALAGRHAATGHADGSIEIFDIDTASRIGTLRRGAATVSALVFAGGADRVAAGARDSAVTVWDTGKPHVPVRVLEGHDSSVQAIAYAARGPFIATGAGDRSVKLWSLEKGELIRTYRGHRSAVTATAFDAKGRVLASGSSDGQIRLWSTYAKRLKRQLSGHQGNVSALAFAPDGLHLISGGPDGTVRIWDCDRGRVVRTITTGVGSIGVLAVSADGQRIAAGGSDGAVRVFAAALPREGS
jgi:WD40 repeat protein